MDNRDALFESERIIGTSQCDVSAKWKLHSMLEAIQDAGTSHCRRLGISSLDLRDRKLSWVIFRTDMFVYRYPELGEKVTVQTFTKGGNYKFYPRYYQVFDQNHEVVCKAGSLWMLMDILSRRTVSLNESGVVLPDYNGMNELIAFSAVKRKIDGKEHTWTYQPVYNDIDLNGHVNNTMYAEWLCNALGINMMKEYEVESLSIAYNYEILSTDLVTCKLCQNSNEFLFQGSVDIKPSFEIHGETKRRQF